MTRARKTYRQRSTDNEAVSGVPRADVVEVDATVVPVGTFAAGQSEDGRYVAVTAAPQGDFAEGQADEDAAIPPETREAPHAYDPGTPTEPSARR